ncbi:MAG: Shedu anti-phage system protein SduA domain-containing protein [bacterium]
MNKEEPVLIIPHEGGLKAVNFNFLGLNRISDFDSKKIVNVYTKSNKRIQELDKALEEFNLLINKPNIQEEEIHQFVLQNPIFLMGLNYKSIRSKIILERVNDGDLIPDFFLEPLYDPHWDILDLKKPDSKLLVSKKNRNRFSANVFEAISQLRTYGDYFSDRANRERIKKKYGIQCYKPKLVVVIGNKHAVDPKLLKDAEIDVNKVQIKSYDDIYNEVLFIRDWMAR